MFELAIPPVTEVQQSQYEFYKHQNETNQNRWARGQRNFLRLIFIHQANALKSLAEDDIHSIADPSYARLAIESYEAYIRYSKD